MNKFQTYIFLVLFIILASNLFIMFNTVKLTKNAGNVISQGEIGICFNNPPIINISDCNLSIEQNIVYSCSVTATDEDNQIVTFSSEMIDEENFVNITNWGLIDFVANQSQVGFHQMNITADDSSGCGITNVLYNFTITNVNDAPYLATNIPDQEITQYQSVTFFLTDFFTDPDGDVMNFTKTITDKLSVIISGSEVSITSNECGFTETIIFTATDPHNLSADSNVVTVTINCPSSTTDTSSSSGGGGGGGGGSSSNGDCEPDYICGSWESCTPNGTQRKKCVDLRRCENVNYDYLFKECKYIAHCYNELLDFDEEGIDCGGTDCKVCPTCDDEIQNGDETGIDCGGNCEPCKIIQTPGVIGSKIIWPTYLVVILVLLVLLLLTYKFYRVKIKILITKIQLLFVGKISKVLLLNKEEADNIIRELNLIIEKYKLGGKLKNSLIFDLMTLGRNYYVKAFKVKITISENKLFEIINKKSFNDDLNKILKGFFKKIELIEKGKIIPKKEEFEQMAEEIKEIIYLTSPWMPRRGLLQKKESIKDLVGEEKIYALLHNALFALAFNESNKATKDYLIIMREYDNLLMKEKEKVYPDLIRLYKEILYSKRIK